MERPHRRSSGRVAEATLPLVLMTCLAAAPAILREEWHDDARDRALPVRIDSPTDGTNLPVVLISHGLGGSREGLATIGTYWADHGYVAVHLQHAGSDESIWRGAAMKDLAKNLKTAESPLQLLARIGDVTFALDELARRNDDPKWPLHGRLDLTRIAMAGHSYGAITTQAMCGERFPNGKSAFDPRIKVGVVFSPSPPAVGDAKRAFATMKVPLFYWTGTEDRVPAMVQDLEPIKRRVPFDSADQIDQYLVILTGGDHMVYNGRPRANAAASAKDAVWLDLDGHGTTAFLDKYLKGDGAQAKYLDDGGFAEIAKPLGTFEPKPAKPPA